MNSRRAFFKLTSLTLTTAAVALIAPASLLAMSARAIAAPTGYAVLSPAQRTDTPGKIEVIEFFSWGCPHCYEFYPLLGSWTSKLPKDVAFKRVPISFGHPQWANLSRAYYALEVTGDANRVDAQLFEAIHKERLPLFDERSITEWVGQHGVDPAKFTAAFNSFGVNARLAQSEQMAIGYKVEGVPTLAIAGKYTISGEHGRMLAVSNELIAKARAGDSH